MTFSKSLCFTLIVYKTRVFYGYLQLLFKIYFLCENLLKLYLAPKVECTLKWLKAKETCIGLTGFIYTVRHQNLPKGKGKSKVKVFSVLN
jgi:hypothetical protein